MDEEKKPVMRDGDAELLAVKRIERALSELTERQTFRVLQFVQGRALERHDPMAGLQAMRAPDTQG